MSITNRAINICGMMLDARDAVRRLPSYKTSMPKVKATLRSYAEIEGVDLLDGMIVLVERSKENPTTIMWLLAAYAELAETGEAE